MPSLIDVLMVATPATTPYLVGLLAGFLIGAIGHLTKAPLLILAGILLIVTTVALFVIASEP